LQSADSDEKWSWGLPASFSRVHYHYRHVVWPINPFRLNERLTVQRGLFLAPDDVRQSFAANLAALPGHDAASNVTHFVLARSESANLARELWETNVTDATLFPGLDGFTKSLWRSIRFLNLTDLKTFFGSLGGRL